MKDLFLDRLIPVRGDSYGSKAKTLTWIHVLGTLQLVFSALGTFQCLLQRERAKGDPTCTEPLEFVTVAHKRVSKVVILSGGHSITEPSETSFH